MARQTCLHGLLPRRASFHLTYDSHGLGQGVFVEMEISEAWHRRIRCLWLLTYLLAPSPC